VTHAALAGAATTPPPLPKPPVAATVPARQVPVPAAAPKPVPTGIQASLTININAPDNYAHPALPAYYDAKVLGTRNTPADNPVTDKGATLGRVLFHDRSLSVNNTVSCATCHQQTNGFAPLTPVSKGFLGVAGTMHAMRLGNVAFYRGNAMFWDKRAPTLEAQATQPIQNAIEMGYDSANGGMAALIARMQSLPYYPELFTAVYGDPTITQDRMARALSQYMRSMVSTGSRWDLGYAKVFNAALPDRGLSLPVPGFTAQENRGKDLFLRPRAEGGAGCAGCHRPPTFALEPDSKSNGLDFGETRIFKSASLKNIARGRPMMHDGRFTTFEQVIAHYNLGIKDGPALDPRLRSRQGSPAILNLPPSDLASLAAFLGTLDDQVLRADPRFLSPFRH
jgi:cytochrome c peroxidase